MKHKKQLAFLLGILLLLLSMAGCKDPVDPTGTEGPPTWPTLPYEQLYLPKPENPGSSLCEYDPARRLYIVQSHMSLNIYSTMGGLPLRFYVISKDPLFPDDFTVSLPVPYRIDVQVFSVRLTRRTEWNIAAQSDEALPFYLYQAYRGLDFSDEKKYDSVLRDFKRLQPEHLPEFYAYVLSVTFPDNDVIEEYGTIDYADITILGETYRVDTGHVRLYPDEAYPVDENVPMLPNDLAGTGEFQQLYSEGALRMIPVFNVRATEETVLSRIYMVNEGFEILGVEVSKTYRDEDGEVANLDFMWDGTSPLYVNPGEILQLRPIVYSPELDCMQSYCDLWFMLDIYIDGVRYQNKAHFVQLSEMNWYELYAIVFDGLDMEPYYRDYYYVHNELWRQDIQIPD